jgi:cytoskeletal protein RodZ
MNQDRVVFGTGLREKREARSMTLSDMSKVTKIPEKSLALLESGTFDELPAEVFVRGFLRSYCRALGADVDATLRSYGALTTPKAKREVAAEAAALALVKSEARPEVKDREKEKEKEKDAKSEPETPAAADDPSFFQALSGAGRSTGRVSLTLAVIILVIVATLTLSLLLRRPSHVGDGVSVAQGAAPLAGRSPASLPSIR